MLQLINANERDLYFAYSLNITPCWKLQLSSMNFTIKKQSAFRYLSPKWLNCSYNIHLKCSILIANQIYRSCVGQLRCKLVLSDSHVEHVNIFCSRDSTRMFFHSMTSMEPVHISLHVHFRLKSRHDKSYHFTIQSRDVVFFSSSWVKLPI